MWVFIAAVFVIARKLETTQVHQQVSILIKEFGIDKNNGIILSNATKQTIHLATWINLRIIMLSESSQISPSPPKVNIFIPLHKIKYKLIHRSVVIWTRVGIEVGGRERETKR